MRADRGGALRAVTLRIAQETSILGKTRPEKRHRTGCATDPRDVYASVGSQIRVLRFAAKCWRARTRFDTSLRALVSCSQRQAPIWDGLGSRKSAKQGRGILQAGDISNQFATAHGCAITRSAEWRRVNAFPEARAGGAAVDPAVSPAPRLPCVTGKRESITSAGWNPAGSKGEMC